MAITLGGDNLFCACVDSCLLQLRVFELHIYVPDFIKE